MSVGEEDPLLIGLVTTKLSGAVGQVSFLLEMSALLAIKCSLNTGFLLSLVRKEFQSFKGIIQSKVSQPLVTPLLDRLFTTRIDCHSMNKEDLYK